MDARYTYLLLNMAVLAVPLAFSFEKKIAFYRKWRFALPAIAATSAVFLAWDVWFTAQGVWSFNPEFVTGIKFLGLPAEEWLFFVTVPYASIFIYENVKFYLKPLTKAETAAGGGFVVMGTALLIAGFIFSENAYTFSSFIGCGLFLLLWRLWLPASDVPFVLAAYLVHLLPFFLVNGLLTSLPVVQYNEAENLGIQLFSIPVEDTFYALLLFAMNVGFYEKIRAWSAKHSYHKAVAM